MGKKIAFLAIAFAIVAFTQPAYAQQAGKVYRIGFLKGSPNMDSRNTRAFRRGLRELGYVEGRNIIIEWRHTNRQRDIFAGKVNELVRLGVDCIVTVGDAATRAAKEGTNTIPIVMAGADGDPVRHGLIASYARPGGNVTGDFFARPENLGLVAAAGCKALFSGIESFDDATLKSYNKKQNTIVPQVEMIKSCLDAGIVFSYGVMLDPTTRHLRDLRGEIEFILSRPEITLPAYFTLAIPLIGTP